jgi:hypothetical protein
MDFESPDIHLGVAKTVERTIGSEARSSRTDPTRWREDPAAPIEADLILRVVRCPQAPLPAQLARLSMRVAQAFRRG